MTAPLSVTETRLVHALLLPDRDAAAAARAYLDEVDLQVLPWSQTRMFPALYQRCTTLGVATPPLLKGTYRRTWAQNQARYRAAADTMSALDAAGIRNVVLKGAALVPAYGGDWGVRDMADVDLLVDVANVHRAAAILESRGWQPWASTSAEGALARHLLRRHSWNFHRDDGAGLDLHWHVLEGSRGPASDRAFLERAEPLELSGVHATRLCDADLLLHVLEHAAHGEEPARLLWIVDAVHLLRAVSDLDALSVRLAQQASAHDLLANTRTRLAEISELTHEPAVASVLTRLGASAAPAEPATTSRRSRFAEYRRGGTTLPAAAVTWARAEIDGALARRPAAWAAYVASGRRPYVERLLVRRGGPLTRTPSAVEPPADADGWWDMWTPETVDACCGPGWSAPEPLAEGVWTDGAEARLSVPAAGAGRVLVDMTLTVLGRHGGPPRTTSVRANGATLATVHAQPADVVRQLTVAVTPDPAGRAEISLRVAGAARPIDLGIGPDVRRLGVRLGRLRVRPLAGH